MFKAETQRPKFSFLCTLHTVSVYLINDLPPGGGCLARAARNQKIVSNGDGEVGRLAPLASLSPGSDGRSRVTHWADRQANTLP